MNLEDIMRSETRLSQKDKHHRIHLCEVPKKVRPIEAEQNDGCQELRQGNGLFSDTKLQLSKWVSSRDLWHNIDS
jgi:hypothetical protein